ncbi:hypothetical protein [Ruegeria arenilitoris]|uniref:hypothetical protein n=1 Tax=Ruegeria arenilitoris TaxID=1173585 RepID=UPI003C7C3355
MDEIPSGLKDVKIWSKDEVTLVCVENFDDEMKELLKKRLAEICWGPTANGSSLVAESYKETMRSLWARVKKKPAKTKIGMVGELLTHLFLAEPGRGFVSVNCMFNLEEASIKKGFDLVLKAEHSTELFLVEVKSSAVQSTKASAKLFKLLKVSDKDIAGKLNNPADNLWSNALSHCSSALRKTDLRDRIEEILGQYRDESLALPTSDTRNVILSGVSFNGAKGFCDPVELCALATSYTKWGNYKSLTLFVLEKDTYEGVLSFIQNEAA